MFRALFVSVALVATSSPAFAALSSYRCVTRDEARPHFTFFVSVDAVVAGISERNRSRIDALAVPFLGAEIVARVVPVQGCSPARVAMVSRDSIYVECDADGDAGFLDLKADRAGKLTGKMNFPEGSVQFGLDSDTVIRVSCVRTR